MLELDGGGAGVSGESELSVTGSSAVRPSYRRNDGRPGLEIANVKTGHANGLKGALFRFDERTNVIRNGTGRSGLGNTRKDEVIDIFATAGSVPPPRFADNVTGAVRRRE